MSRNRDAWERNRLDLIEEAIRSDNHHLITLDVSDVSWMIDRLRELGASQVEDDDELDAGEAQWVVPDVHQYIAGRPGPLCPCPACCAKYGPVDLGGTSSQVDVGESTGAESSGGSATAAGS